MAAAPDISIIIPTWNTAGLLAACLDSIAHTVTAQSVEIIVVDNASTDDTASVLGELYPSVRLVRNDENVGFAAAANRGAALSAGRYLLFLNSDARLLPRALAALHALAETQARAGVVGAQLHNPDGSFQASHAGFPTLSQEFLILSSLGRLLYGRAYPSHAAHEERGPQPVDWVSGACMLIRRAAFDALGGFDPGYFMYAEEVDLCYRMRRAGWQTWYEPAAHVLHVGGASSSGHRPAEREAALFCGRVRFFRTHYGDAAAARVKLLIYCFTAVKIVIHGCLSTLSAGRYGRQVMPLYDLRRELNRVGIDAENRTAPAARPDRPLQPSTIGQGEVWRDAMATDLSVCIVSWNTRELLRGCLDSIHGQQWQSSLEVIVVDNASTDGSAAMVRREFPQVRLIANSHNFGFARGSNQAFTQAHGRYALVLNSDIAVKPGALDSMVRFMDRHPDAGMIGCELLNPDGSPQRSCWRGFPSLSTALGDALYLWRLAPSLAWGPANLRRQTDSGEPVEVDHLLGACMMVRREVIAQVGGMNEGLFLFLEDTEWCYRLRANSWKIYYVPSAQMIHFGQGSVHQNPEQTLPEQYRNFVWFYRTHAQPSAARVGMLKLVVLLASLLRVVLWTWRARVASKRDQARRMRSGYWEVARRALSY
jgi:N-acetylglucosaminyl-diphospho-decaprenol L-rhamnosyltransferase